MSPGFSSRTASADHAGAAACARRAAAPQAGTGASPQPPATLRNAADRPRPWDSHPGGRPACCAWIDGAARGVWPGPLPPQGVAQSPPQGMQGRRASVVWAAQAGQPTQAAPQGQGPLLGGIHQAAGAAPGAASSTVALPSGNSPRRRAVRLPGGARPAASGAAARPAATGWFTRSGAHSPGNLPGAATRARARKLVGTSWRQVCRFRHANRSTQPQVPGQAAASRIHRWPQAYCAGASPAGGHGLPPAARPNHPQAGQPAQPSWPNLTPALSRPVATPERSALSIRQARQWTPPAVPSARPDGGRPRRDADPARHPGGPPLGPSGQKQGEPCRRDARQAQA